MEPLFGSLVSDALAGLGCLMVCALIGVAAIVALVVKSGPAKAIIAAKLMPKAAVEIEDDDDDEPVVHQVPDDLMAKPRRK